jgi:hypothetical protein
MTLIFGLATSVLTGTQLWSYMENRKKAKENLELKDLHSRINELELKADPEYVTQQTIEGIESLAEVSELLVSTKKYGVERVILWCGHNGGGVPQPGKPFYTTAMQWHILDDKSNYDLSNYRHITVDPTYINMLLQVLQTNTVMLSTSEMSPCQLKTYYKAEGVTHSMIIKVGIKPKQIFYLSMAKYKDEPFSEADLVGCELIANSVWQQVKKW